MIHDVNIGVCMYTIPVNLYNLGMNYTILILNPIHKILILGPIHKNWNVVVHNLIIPPLPEGGGGYTVLPPSVQDIFRRIFLSNC